MRSAVAVAAFAAGVVAVPYKRDVVTNVEIVYLTDIVTVWATAPATPESTTSVEVDPAAATSTSSEHYGHGHHHWSWAPSAEETTSAAPETTSVYVAPTTSEYVAPTTSTSVYVAPTTLTSEYVAPTTSEYVAPTTSSTSVWVAPTTSSIQVQAAVTSEAPAAASSPTSYNDIVIAHHNLHRANHSAPDLAWDDSLANSAQEIANSCVYAHNVDAAGGGYGQNIAAGVKPANISAIITDLFYNGEVNSFNGLYGQAQPDMSKFESWGHFSQIVWKATTHVGCATTHCPNGLGNVGSGVAPYFTVCNYKNPGNFANKYGINVGAPLNHGTAEWNYFGSE